MDNIKSRIGKLLNLAKDDAASEGEVENALTLAARLMASHNLTEAECANASSSNYVMQKSTAYSCGTIRSVWEDLLGYYVCEAVGGVKYYIRSKQPLSTLSGVPIRDDNGDTQIRNAYIFYGEAERSSMAAMLFDETRLLIAAMARLRYGGILRGDGNYYAYGFVSGLRSKLRESLAAERAGTALSGPSHSSTAIVPLTPTQREQLDSLNKTLVAKAEHFIESELGVKIRKSRPTRASFSYAPYSQGVKDGTELDPIKPTSRKKLKA